MGKVKVKSLVNGTVGLLDRDLRVNRTWNKKGAVYSFDKEILEELMYDPGVEYMFKEGILAIVGEEADKVNIELGLQSENEEKKILDLSDDKIEEILAMKMADFRTTVKNLTYEQQRAMVDYCIEHKFRDYDKDQFLKGLTQVDVLKAIELDEQDKEQVKAKEE